jgi:lysophospholipase L1-like esterase
MSVASPRNSAIAVIVLALGIAGVVTYKRSQHRSMSDEITTRWDALGGEPWLLPNLKNARVVQPDRPHSFTEVHAWRKGEGTQITRTREYRLRTNSQRMRGPEFGAKDAKATRIIAIGDSVTHGWGVKESESYPAQLKMMLGQQGQQAEVLNAGVPANPVSVMARWCTGIAPSLSPDIILWTRRPSHQSPAPIQGYVQAVRACQQATGAKVLVVLPPISTFDLRGSQEWEGERDSLSQQLQPSGIGVLELTDIFRKAQQGRGEILVDQGNQVAIVDQETGNTWLTAPKTRNDLHPTIYALFEKEPTVREALFFDEGHPDAAGFTVFAQAVSEALAPLLNRPPTRP